ncbi:MAG: ankyrin repeat domain-containing protein [Ekhidna sp.]
MELLNYIRSGQIAPIKQLLAKHPELADTPDERGFTPLVLATYLGQKEIAELLIDHGAKIDAQDALGNTALMGVCFKGSYDLAEMLVSKGANIHLINKEGMNAFSFAQKHGQEAIANLLKDASLKTPEANMS